MRARTFLRLDFLARLLFFSICVWAVTMVVEVNSSLAELQAKSRPGLPFGVFTTTNGSLHAQDFSYNLLFLKAVRDNKVAHPYRLEDQERTMRQVLPSVQSGISHAYSPVALILALPLLSLSGAHAYLAYTGLCAAGIILLFYFYLLPRVKSGTQLLALAICAGSICMVLVFDLGQSSMLSTTLIGAIWALAQQRSKSISTKRDIAIAILFWAVCFKPSVAIIPLAVLLGAKAWRPLIIAAILLLITWIYTGPLYGGWVTGLSDYFHLLTHYNNAEFTPFMQRHDETSLRQFFLEHAPMLFQGWFPFARAMITLSILGLLLLRWTNRISASEHFQGMVWAFLIFSPYLLVTENWILCLLIVEGSFFVSKRSFETCLKLLLLAALFDIRAFVSFPDEIEYPLKCLLFAWVLVAWWWTRSGTYDVSPDDPRRQSEPRPIQRRNKD